MKTRLSMSAPFHDEQLSLNLALSASHPSCIKVSPFHPSTCTLKILDSSSRSHQLCFWNMPGRTPCHVTEWQIALLSLSCPKVEQPLPGTSIVRDPMRGGRQQPHQSLDKVRKYRGGGGNATEWWHHPSPECSYEATHF